MCVCCLSPLCSVGCERVGSVDVGVRVGVARGSTCAGVPWRSRVHMHRLVMVVAVSREKRRQVCELVYADPQPFWLKAARGRAGATLPPPSCVPPPGGPLARIELIGFSRHQGGAGFCGPVYGLVGWWCISIASSNRNPHQHSLDVNPCKK